VCSPLNFPMPFSLSSTMLLTHYFGFTAIAVVPSYPQYPPNSLCQPTTTRPMAPSIIPVGIVSQRSISYVGSGWFRRRLVLVSDGVSRAAASRTQLSSDLKVGILRCTEQYVDVGRCCCRWIKDISGRVDCFHGVRVSMRTVHCQDAYPAHQDELRCRRSVFRDGLDTCSSGEGAAPFENAPVHVAVTRGGEPCTFHSNSIAETSFQLYCGRSTSILITI
jgi:hypothetical protein